MKGRVERGKREKIKMKGKGREGDKKKRLIYVGSEGEITFFIFSLLLLWSFPIALFFFSFFAGQLCEINSGGAERRARKVEQTTK